jgi:hypothetical protein
MALGVTRRSPVSALIYTTVQGCFYYGNNNTRKSSVVRSGECRFRLFESCQADGVCVQCEGERRGTRKNTLWSVSVEQRDWEQCNAYRLCGQMLRKLAWDLPAACVFMDDNARWKREE